VGPSGPLPGLRNIGPLSTAHAPHQRFDDPTRRSIPGVAPVPVDSPLLTRLSVSSADTGSDGGRNDRGRGSVQVRPHLLVDAPQKGAAPLPDSTAERPDHRPTGPDRGISPQSPVGGLESTGTDIHVLAWALGKRGSFQRVKRPPRGVRPRIHRRRETPGGEPSARPGQRARPPAGRVLAVPTTTWPHLSVGDVPGGPGEAHRAFSSGARR